MRSDRARGHLTGRFSRRLGVRVGSFSHQFQSFLTGAGRLARAAACRRLSRRAATRRPHTRPTAPGAPADVLPASTRGTATQIRCRWDAAACSHASRRAWRAAALAPGPARSRRRAARRRSPREAVAGAVAATPRIPSYLSISSRRGWRCPRPAAPSPSRSPRAPGTQRENPVAARAHRASTDTPRVCRRGLPRHRSRMAGPAPDAAPADHPHLQHQDRPRSPR